MMESDDLRKHVDGFEWFINGEGSTRPDAERGALISLGYVVTSMIERIAEIERRIDQQEQLGNE